jgi:asparagine synthase (glutamine-hydrolysing)
MCGIAVAIDWPGAETVVARMIEGLTHRGDVTDPLVSPRPNTAMCTRRLRIVDAAGGAQPKLSHDGRVLVSFNGQIYNHADLRRELEAEGIGFHSESDTELLATAISVWGARALERFQGMYAFVALDLQRGDFLAARDPLGVKPLYLVQSPDGGFLFCSEIRPLLNAAETGEVMLLPPGHLLTKTLCAPFPTPFTRRPELGPASLETFDRILASAVHARVPPSLPFALMLSGGIDSTLVAHYSRQVRTDASAYFLGDADATDYRFASEYAERNGVDLRTVSLPTGGDATLDLIDRAIAATEAFEPCILRPSLCNYVLAERIHADGFRVALCGEGADELFAGYPPLEAAFATSQEAGAFTREQYLAGMNRSNLQRVDRCAMHFMVETREPFLDAAVIDYALACEASALVERTLHGLRGKKPLRDLYGLYPEALPASIRDRKKLPFSEGAGFETGLSDSPCIGLAEAAISDADLAEGQREFEAYNLKTKEELFYLRKLSALMDIERVPHLKGRLHLFLPAGVDVSAFRDDLLPPSPLTALSA